MALFALSHCKKYKFSPRKDESSKVYLNLPFKIFESGKEEVGIY